ncbi:MAG TPA: sensor histidine kinase [Acidimicrobiales bacterium]
MDEEPRWRPPLSDALLAAGFAALSVSIGLGVVEGPADRVGAAALGVLHSAPLAVRRRWPELALAAMAATGLLYVLAGYPPVGLGPAIVAAVYTVAALCPRARSVPAVAAACVAMALVVLRADVGLDTVVGNSLVFGVAWLVGDRQRHAREEAAQERQRAEEVERSRDENARRAVAAERLRIARELHDVVAHAMSVIVVQAGTGRVVIDDDPGQARDALAAIETTSRTALGEMRRLLTVLRADDDGAGDGNGRQPLLPAPGLCDLDGLVAASEKAGLPVTVQVEGVPADLPAGVDLAAYRIVQEALTNVRRHAHATRATVTVGYQPGGLAIDVADDGSGPGEQSRAGQGLVGMRERAALYGGTLETGPGPDGGFRVRLRIPLADG